MQPPIDGAIALITGASSGIGLALAQVLAPRVKTLILVARRGEKLESLAKELGQHASLEVEVRACDLTDRQALDRMLDEVLRRHGHVDLLVNNAGRGDFGIFDQTSWAHKEQLIELNVRVPSYLVHRLAPSMVARGKGGILNVSSGIGFMPLFPGMGVYAASKHFLTAFSETLRLELAPAGVVVTTVCPGPVESEFLHASGAGKDEQPPAFLMISAEQCARESIRGFEAGRALVSPGLLTLVSNWMTRLTPRFVMRVAFAAMARSLRKKLSLGSESRAQG